MDIRFQTKQVIKQAVQNVVLPVCYQMSRSRAVDPELVVFADAHHNSRPAAMELLYHRLKKQGTFRIVEHYLDYGSAGAAAVAKHSMRFMQLYASARYVVICDNFLPVASCAKRKETKVIQLWHACGCYKRFGYDAPDDIPKDYHGANVYRNADLVTVSGKAAVRPFASAMRLPEHCVQPIGVSRTDLYARKAWRDRCRKQFYEKYPLVEGALEEALEEVSPDSCSSENKSSGNKNKKKVVLWAPTFRGNAGVPQLPALDLNRLQMELGEDYLVLACLHPHLLRAMKQGAGKQTGSMRAGIRNGETGDSYEPFEDFVCDIPTEELYPVADVLIADYSSLIYEYLLFQKPLVLYVPDLEAYRSRRGFYMEIEEIPGQIVKKEQELAAAVKQAVESSGKHAGRNGSPGDCAKLEKFLSTYMGACDGKATERIAAWMTQ